jgi:hypothetical protein
MHFVVLKKRWQEQLSEKGNNDWRHMQQVTDDATYSIVRYAEPIPVRFMIKCETVKVWDEMPFWRIYYLSLSFGS